MKIIHMLRPLVSLPHVDLTMTLILKCYRSNILDCTLKLKQSYAMAPYLAVDLKKKKKKIWVKVVGITV
jgi:uncharacterized protein YunC (DUF1805 family)